MNRARRRALRFWITAYYSEISAVADPLQTYASWHLRCALLRNEFQQENVTERWSTASVLRMGRIGAAVAR